MIKSLLFVTGVALTVACGASSAKPKDTRVVTSSTEIEIYQPLTFTAGSDQLPADAEKTLTAVANTLNGNPNLLKISVQGYTVPEDGATPEARKELGTRRAKLVYDGLLAHGVAADRLAYEPAEGGPARIEFLVLKRKDDAK